MTTTTIKRRQTSFRLRTDLLEGLKAKAAHANRTLNNYVETLLMNDVTEYLTPNQETIHAIEEARSHQNDPDLEIYDNVDDLMKALS